MFLSVLLGSSQSMSTIPTNAKLVLNSAWFVRMKLNAVFVRMEHT